MKKTAFVLLLLAGGLFTTQAQNVAVFNEAGFEEWDSTQGFHEPKGWFTLNPLSIFGYPETTIMTTDAHSGMYAVRLESKPLTMGALSGVLSSGPLLGPTGNPDFSKMKVAYTNRPTKFEFYFKADPEPGDSGVVALMLTRWNQALQKSDTIGHAVMVVGDSTSTYQHADITITYESPLPPDSAYVIASSSMDGFNPTAGSVLLLDDFKVSGGSTGNQEALENDPQVRVFPNPATAVVYLQADREVFDWQILDLTGKVLFVLSGEHSVQSLDCRNIAAGVYLVKANGNGFSTTSKLIVE